MACAIITSAKDKKQYKTLVLDNKMKVLLISTRAADSRDSAGADEAISAASFAVNVGSFCDPPEVQGLAHLTEHMIFMESRRFPGANAFDAFLQERGGSTNAWTDTDVTCFSFDVRSEHLKEALDRFSDKLIRPWLKKSRLEAELQAVESEWAINKGKVQTRFELLLNSTASTQHPTSKFSWGNQESLGHIPAAKGIDLHTSLKQFFRRYYVGTNASIAVQSHHPIQTLEKWVKEMFGEMRETSGIRRRDFRSIDDPFETIQFRKLYRMSGIGNEMYVTWSLPRDTNGYKKKPIGLVARLIEHKACGGLLSTLRKNAYATDIEAVQGDAERNGASGWSTFSVRISLSALGLDHFRRVLDLLYQYLHVLKDSEAPHRDLFQEIAAVQGYSFDWEEPQSAFDYTQLLAVGMHHYDEAEYVIGSAHHIEYDRDSVQAYLEKLLPEKMNVVLMSSTFSDGLDLAERWCGTRYTCGSFAVEDLERWSSAKDDDNIFDVRIRNSYIAQSFEILQIAADCDAVTIIDSSAKGRLHYTQECAAVAAPKAHVKVCLRMDKAGRHPRHRCLLDIYLQIVKQCIDDVIDQAERAGITFTVETCSNGLLLSLQGFSDKLLLVLYDAIRKIAALQISEELYQLAGEIVCSIYDQEKANPEVLVQQLQLSVVTTNLWTVLQKCPHLSIVDCSAMIDFARDIHRESYVDMIIEGNVSRQDAIDCFRFFLSKLDIWAMSSAALTCLLKPTCTQLPRGISLLCVPNTNLNDTNTVITNYYEFGLGNVRDRILNELLVSVMDAPLFEYLRTVRQLGYTAACETSTCHGNLGLTITVCSQANRFSVEELDDAIEEFIEKFRRAIANMSKEHFAHHIESLKDSKDGDEYLDDKTDRHWSEIADATHVFDRPRLEMNELANLTISDLQRWFDQILPASCQRKKLSVSVRGSTPVSATGSAQRRKKIKLDADVETRMQAKRKRASQNGRCSACNRNS